MSKSESPLPAVSAIVIARRDSERVAKTVRPLLADPGADEVLVVVDGADAETDPSRLRQVAGRDDRFRLIERPERGGSEAARRTGAEAARGEVLLMLDDDVVPDGTLATAHARAQAEEDAPVVVGYMPIGTEGGSRLNAPARLYQESYEDMFSRFERDPDGLLLNFWSGNHSVLRAAYLRMDPPEALPYHADRDFGLRAIRAGLTAVARRDVRAEHRHSWGLLQWRRLLRWQGQGRVLIHDRHGDLVGPYSPDCWEEGLGRFGAGLVRLCRRRAVRWVVEPTLLVVTAGAAVFRLHGVEHGSARVLRSVGQQVGALAELRRLNGATPTGP
jgi:Glycosyl transferase family 2